MEKYIERGRHIEVQVVADNHGNVVHLCERSALFRDAIKNYRRSPVAVADSRTAEEMCRKAVALMKAIGYTNAGTVEFLFDSATSKYYFLEVNARLQVEHGITELITGLGYRRHHD